MPAHMAGRPRGQVKGNTMIVHNITADDYPDEPQLRRVSPSTRKQMGMGPEIEPFPEFFRRRLLETIRHDDELRADLVKLLREVR
jgi:hypothetical protein